MPRDDAVGGGLALGQADERLDLLRETRPGPASTGMLAAQVLGLPAQHVAEQDRGLVVEVVSGHQHVVAAVERRLVEQVALGQTAGRARRAPGGLRRRSGCRSRSSSARSTSIRWRPRGLGEATGVPGRGVAVLADAEPDVQPVGLVAERDEDVPDGERVLAPGHGDEDPVVRREHVEVRMALATWSRQNFSEVVRAEVRVVPADVDHGRARGTRRTSRSVLPRSCRAPRDDRSDLDHVVVVRGVRRPGRSCRCGSPARDSRLRSSRSSSTETSTGASTVSSRVGFRSRTSTPP